MFDKMDCIVVGAGMAGCAAAYKLASEGLQVLLVDRGKPIGSKNLSGGVLWGHDLAEILGNDWYEEAPIERPITSKGVHMLTEDAGFSMQIATDEWKQKPYNGFAVLRAKMDKWLAEQVEAAGGMVVEGVNVEHVAQKDGKVVGIEQGGDVIPADSVIIADGCNSRLTMDLGLRGKLDREHYVLGVKEIVKLDKKTIEDRFNLDGDDEGSAHEYVCGWLGDKGKAGGFLYTNEDTISLGVVVNLDSIWQKGTYTEKIMEQFRLHPTIKPLLKGGKMVEYGAHLIPEGGLNIVPKLYGNGFLVAGDAAGLVYSNGLVIQGMNYAVKSGILAAESVIMAHERGDYSWGTLGVYEQKLNDSYIMKDFKRFQGMHDFVWDKNMHEVIPQLATGVFKDLIRQDGTPKEHVRDIARKKLKETGTNPLSLTRTMLKGAKNL